MHKFFILFTFMVISAAVCGQSNQRNALKLGIPQMFYSTIQISYERFSSDSAFTFQVSGSFTARKMLLWEEVRAQVSGFGAEIQGRHNFKYKQRNFYCGFF